MFKRRLVIPLVLFAAAAIAAPVCASEAVLYSFTGGTDGGNPNIWGAGLAAGPDGALYGTTTSGGANGQGTIFKITTAGAFSALHSFTGSDGSQAGGRMVLGKDGNFYGTTATGGAGNNGTFYRISPSGSGFTKLFDFPQGSAISYAPPLTLGSDGNFYGVRDSSSGGYIFQLTPAGTFTTLYAFNSAYGGDVPDGIALAEGPDHNFYGMTEYLYGAEHCGTAFKITAQGQLTTIHAFHPQDAIGCPGYGNTGGLVLGDDGNFYGSTGEAVFSMTPSGSVTLLYSLAAVGANLYDSSTGLAKGSNGTFWGADSYGWIGTGAVFSVTTSGAFEWRYDFGRDPAPQNPGDAQNPNLPPVVASNGNVYGLGANGGAYGKGAIYYITPNSAVALTPHSAQPLSFTRQCETATALNTSGVPVGGVALAFQTLGVDSTSGMVTTSAQGTTQYCWSNTKVGLAVLRVSDGKLNDSARYFWQPHKTVLTAYPSTLQLINPLQVNLKLSARLMDVSLTPNVPVAGQTVYFSQVVYNLAPGVVIGGSPVCTAVTDASGLASCSGLEPVVQTTLGFDAAYYGNAVEYVNSSAVGTLLTAGSLVVP